jgi:hypothetical protein
MKKLNSKSMAAVNGGVSRAVYCNTLNMIIVNNPITPAMLSAWGTNCAPYGVKVY